VKGKCATRDQPGKLPGVVGVVGALAEKCVALGLVDDDLQAQHVHEIPGLGLQLQQAAPPAVMRVAVDNALHELGDDERQIWFGSHPPLLAYVTRGSVAVRSRPSVADQVIRSRCRSS